MLLESQLVSQLVTNNKKRSNKSQLDCRFFRFSSESFKRGSAEAALIALSGQSPHQIRVRKVRPLVRAGSKLSSYHIRRSALVRVLSSRVPRASLSSRVPGPSVRVGGRPSGHVARGPRRGKGSRSDTAGRREQGSTATRPLRLEHQGVDSDWSRQRLDVSSRGRQRLDPESYAQVVVYANAAAQLMKMIYVSSAHQANNTADTDSARETRPLLMTSPAPLKLDQPDWSSVRPLRLKLNQPPLKLNSADAELASFSGSGSLSTSPSLPSPRL